MRAQDVMLSRVIVVRPELPVRELAELLDANGITGAPVVDADGNLIGIVSHSDLAYRPALEAGEQPAGGRERTVADIMTRQVVTVSPDASLDEVAALLASKAIDRVPVVADRRIVGIVSRTDLEPLRAPRAAR